MPKAIFVTRRIPNIGIQMLEKKAYMVDVNPKDSILTQKQIIGFLKKKPYDAVLTLLTDHIDSAVFDASPTVKLFANYATGFDNIDVVEARKRGVVVTNSPAELASEAVAEHAIALMLALAARIVEADEFVRRGKYKGWSAMNFIGTNVLGKTLGLIGAGRIGERVARYAKGLGLKIIYTDVVRNDRIEKECDATYRGSTEEVLREADVVSLHVPLLDSTKHLINEVSLRLMKPTSFLVNTSRGPVVDEKALEKALREKVIAAAALDVFEFEPKTVPGLTKLQNVILTPHIASASLEARNQMAEISAQNIIDFFEGRTPKNIVNP
ncbi:MAG: D-isomer specific 2-hydroxyacid dehydrogenase, NAD-binding protein [Parcubacteria group bacterium GW2011_GWA2_47_16]|nr:MAG: D-isomer specific 2-hydroxyacid dehydrogenase, NAD-binding protein [Parcubacteria group bacterium GW2011_GWA2_47_16]